MHDANTVGNPADAAKGPSEVAGSGAVLGRVAGCRCARHQQSGERVCGNFDVAGTAKEPDSKQKSRPGMDGTPI